MPTLVNQEQILIYIEKSSVVRETAIEKSLNDMTILYVYVSIDSIKSSVTYSLVEIRKVTKKGQICYKNLCTLNTYIVV